MTFQLIEASPGRAAQQQQLSCYTRPGTLPWQLPWTLPKITLSPGRFTDEFGRTLILRGVNVGGSKIPFTPDGRFELDGESRTLRYFHTTAREVHRIAFEPN